MFHWQNTPFTDVLHSALKAFTEPLHGGKREYQNGVSGDSSSTNARYNRLREFFGSSPGSRVLIHPFKRAVYGRVCAPRNALPLFNSSLYCQTGLKLATDRSILARSLKKSSCCRRKRSSNIRGARFTLCTLSKK